MFIKNQYILSLSTTKLTISHTEGIGVGNLRIYRRNKNKHKMSKTLSQELKSEREGLPSK